MATAERLDVEEGEDLLALKELQRRDISYSTPEEACQSPHVFCYDVSS